MDVKKPEPFQFQNQRQEKIYSSLNQFVASAPAALYKDACKIFYGNDGLEAKTNLVGHLLREVFGWVLDYMLPAEFIESKIKKGRNKKKILEAAKLFHLKEKDNLVQLWIKIHRTLHKEAHRDSYGELQPLDKEFIDLWDKTELILDFLLDKIASNYLLYKKQLDGFLSKKTLVTSDLTKIKKHIPLNQITLGYFFERLDTNGCLGILKKTGFFKFPRKPLFHQDGGVSYPFWPQMSYLLKMAKISTEQESVLQICLNVDTDNINTQVQMLEIALELPPEKSLKIVKRSYGWFDQINSWFHPEKFGKLMPHLLKGGYKKETLELAKKLLGVKPDPREPKKIEDYVFPYDPIALFDDWHYEKILKENYPAVIDDVGFEGVKILFDIIESYIDLSDPSGKKRRKDNSSVIWRPAIEDNSQNHNHGIKDLLITGARDSAERFLHAHPEKIIEVVTELEKRKLNIFKRLSLHLLRLFPKGAEVKIVSELLNREEFDSRSVRLDHEYYLLAEKHGKLLNEKQKKQIWSWIMTGADGEDYRKYKIKVVGRKPSNKEIKLYKRNWQMYHLIPYKDIDPKWNKYFDKLKAFVGEPEFPSFSSWMRSGTWGPASSVSSEQLKEMEPEQVVEYLRKWEPPANDPLDRSREGTGRELARQITADPERWSKSALSFVQLDPTYVRSFLGGYHDALKQGKEFDWKPVLRLCEMVLAKPLKVVDRKPSSPFGDDPDWGWCRNTIVEFIEEGLKDHAGKLPIDLRKEAWSIIKQLTDDPNPTPEHEKEQLASHSDPLTIAINTTRGDAMGAAIQYGIWVKKDAEKNGQKGWNLKDNAPELLQVLNDHLNTKKEPSLAIRAIYGEKLIAFFLLDKKWVRDTQDNIFPDGEDEQDYFSAAWETYISFARPFNDVFTLIEKQYRRAIRELGKHTDRKHHLENPDERLAQHLMAFYWSGVVDFVKKDSILVELYHYALVEVKREIIEFMGRNLKEALPISDEVKRRLIYLLESRLAVVKKSKNPKDDSQEFQGFSWWVASGKLDTVWCLKQLREILKLGCDL